MICTGKLTGKLPVNLAHKLKQESPANAKGTHDSSACPLRTNVKSVKKPLF